MSWRSGFDPFHDHPFDGKIRWLFIGAALLLVATVPPLTFEPTAGVSGDIYRVYEEGEAWRAVGPVLSVRYRTRHFERVAVAAEVQDLLPLFAERADSARLRYVIIRATHPVVLIGHRFGLYRDWNFRYERADVGWVASGYW